MKFISQLRKKEFLIPTISFIIIALLIVGRYNQLMLSHTDKLQEHLDLIGKSTLGEFQYVVEHDIKSIENLKIRMEHSDGQTFQYWEEDAKLLLEQYPSVRFIKWIDSSMVVKNIVPFKGNENDLNLDISKEAHRKQEWLEHSIDKSISVSSWSNTIHEDEAFLIDVPVYFNDTFQGSITAGMDFGETLNDIVEDGLDENPIEMSDHTDTVFYGYNLQDIDKENRPLMYEGKILVDSLHDQYWTFKLYPSTSMALSKDAVFYRYFLIAGLCFALLFSSLIYFYFRAKNETKRATAFNEDLLHSYQLLDKERKRTEKASKAKSEFLSNMSHEIRTPLHAILGLIDILKNSKLNQSIKGHIDLLGKSSSELLSIVNDILVIAKIGTGSIKLEKNTFKPSQNVQELIDVSKVRFYEKGLYLTFKAREPYGDIVIGDQQKLNQIINNILKNALKFTRKGGAIVCYEEERLDTHLKVKISIEDSGIGIRKHKIPSIFRKFTQLERSVNRTHEGTGLGLAICRDLAKLMGGSIQVQSAINQGSKFELVFVFERAEAQVTSSIPNLYKIMNLSWVKTLVVDDNKLNVLILKKMLENHHIQVDVAVNGAEAVHKGKRKVYDFVFMDIHMPEMDGFQATSLIRKLNSDVKIIGLSANVTAEASAKAFTSGMDDFMTKPFTKEQIHNMLSRYLSCEISNSNFDILNNKWKDGIEGLSDPSFFTSSGGDFK